MKKIDWNLVAAVILCFTGFGFLVTLFGETEHNTVNAFIGIALYLIGMAFMMIPAFKDLRRK